MWIGCLEQKRFFVCNLEQIVYWSHEIRLLRVQSVYILLSLVVFEQRWVRSHVKVLSILILVVHLSKVSTKVNLLLWFFLARNLFDCLLHFFLDHFDCFIWQLMERNPFLRWLKVVSKATPSHATIFEYTFATIPLCSFESLHAYQRVGLFWLTVLGHTWRGFLIIVSSLVYFVNDIIWQMREASFISDSLPVFVIDLQLRLFYICIIILLEYLHLIVVAKHRMITAIASCVAFIQPKITMNISTTGSDRTFIFFRDHGKLIFDSRIKSLLQLE